MLAGSAVAASSARATTRTGPTVTEARMVHLINQARRHANRWPLQYSAALSRIARTPSALMASKGTICHTKNPAYAFRNFSWTLGAETVGMGPSRDALHHACLRRLPHREHNP